jgi:hypothetical protein
MERAMAQYALELVAPGDPDWERAEEYIEAYNAVRPEDDPDGLARDAIIERYIPANPEIVEVPSDGLIDERLLDRARDLVEDALADATTLLDAERLGDAVVIRAAADSTAHDAIEAAWHAGVLGASGFALPE